MKNAILLFFLTMLFSKNIVANENIEMSEKKCDFYAFYEFAKETKTKMMTAVFEKASPAMAMICQKEILKFKAKEVALNKTYGFKLEGKMLSRYDRDKLIYTRPLTVIGNIGAIRSTMNFNLYYFNVEYVSDYMMGEKSFRAVYFTKEEAIDARKSLVDAYNGVFENE
jgi:hypothetical protein